MENGRNTKMHVGSIIGVKLQRIITKTSTRWMTSKTGDTDSTLRPGTTNYINARRLHSQTVQKDSLSNKRTNASTG